ncbi:MAG: ribosome-associated translation inhibitor RaiA [Clostridiales bacterium]|jgi:putative sigma-54 modulation protein|nr:ribosome-associated translation inhibitor RaiA [Clostridiales bacterium]
MRIEIICKNYTAGDKLKDILTKKIEKLDKYFDDGVSAKINLSESAAKNLTMEITIKTGNTLLRAETTGESQYDNIDVILPKIEKQIVKFKTKNKTKAQKAAEYASFLYMSGYDAGDAGKITKKKKLDLVPMTTDDALDNIDLIGHDFFVFINSETDAVNIVYKRKSGGYGLIELNY